MRGAEQAAGNFSGRSQENFVMTHTATTPFFALFGQMAARAWRVFANRRHFAELQDWSDEQLNDIGLTRSDVRRALAQPFYTDPSSLVTGSAASRQAPSLSAANASVNPVFSIAGAAGAKCGQLAA